MPARRQGKAPGETEGSGILGTTTRERPGTRFRRASIVVALITLSTVTACSDGGPERRMASRPTATATAQEVPSGSATATPTTVEPPSSNIRDQGHGDKLLDPIRVHSGGTTIRWTNRGPKPVFSLLTQDAIIVDAAFDTAGETTLAGGRYVLEVIASGSWTISIPNASWERRGGTR